VQIRIFRSNRTFDRRLSLRFSFAVSDAALIIEWLSYGANTFFVNMGLLLIAASMSYGSQPVLWSIATEILAASVTGLGSGTMNVVGVLGAFDRPHLVGSFRALTQLFFAGLLVMGGSSIGTCISMLLIKEAGWPRTPRVISHLGLMQIVD